MSGDPRTDVTKALADLEAAHAEWQQGGMGAATVALFTFPKAVPALVAAVRAGLALADEMDQELADRGVLLDRVIRPGDRLRTAIAAPLVGQHPTDEETDRG